MRAGALITVVVLGALVFYAAGRSYWVPIYKSVMGKRTVTEVLGEYGPDARSRLVPYFDQAGVAYPPPAITLLAMKDTETLELWARDGESRTFIRDYPIQALSGVAGPKLREGDRQVPEGIYQLEYLNPNSAYHLSFKLNYPNAFDLTHARAEGRVQPGSDIFIHGKAVSIGCLAMGDTVIEELFVLVVDVGKARVDVAIAPTDPRLRGLTAGIGQPAWVGELYESLERYFHPYQKR